MAKERVARFSVSVPESLLHQFDQWIQEKNYPTRSQAVADLIRDCLVEHAQAKGNEELAGTITLVYDHHKASVQQELTEAQHQHLSEIISALHVHLDRDNCLEVIVVKGSPTKIQRIADRLLCAKGVKHGKLTVTTTGRNLPA